VVERIAPLPPLVVTGASGFVGSAVLRALSAAPGRPVTLLARDPSAARWKGLPDDWRVVQCDLRQNPPFAEGTIPGGSVVLHLAAATGRLSPRTMFEVNVEGTRRLVDAAKRAGAAHFIFVSSIAAAFVNQRWYHYAHAKRTAEELVLSSGLAATVVRPTMVFGEGSPVQEGLERLALGGMPIVLGSGNVRVQPVGVNELADLLVSLCARTSPSDRVVEVGGREQVTLRELLARMRTQRGLEPRDPWSVPLGLPRLLLAIAEPLLGPRLPVTAGQLASFLNDSVAAPTEVVRSRASSWPPLDQLLRPAGSGGGESPAREKLRASRDTSADPSATDPSAADATVVAREFATFARFLGSPAPGADAALAYRRAHAAAAAVKSDTFDRWLVAIARRSVLGCAVAESYARLARPHGLLRRKLVLTLAVLEFTPHEHTQYDTARPGAAPLAWLSLLGHGITWGAQTAVAVVFMAPLHLAAKLGGAGRGVGDG